MIDKKSLSKEWILQVSSQNRKADKILIEKTIRALLLLEGLAASSLPFTFKGGTALMLLLDSSKRLSIDIDILISEPVENVELFFPAILKEQSFLRFELQQRQNHSGIQKAHYKFYYNSVSLSAAEDFVLLDIVFSENYYRKIQELPIRSKFMLTTGSDSGVLIPSAEDLLGDKLTAFAPNTTGIPYQRSGNSMSMEIIKQLYDIGTLFEFVAEPQII
ncbi:MAG: nucleotidyl transferase AbiEii/AbiGii toxin family protein, partial [Bacteroidia bacterium]